MERRASISFHAAAPIDISDSGSVYFRFFLVDSVFIFCQWIIIYGQRAND